MCVCVSLVVLQAVKALDILVQICKVHTHVLVLALVDATLLIDVLEDAEASTLAAKRTCVAVGLRSYRRRRLGARVNTLHILLLVLGLLELVGEDLDSHARVLLD